jgi:hypothetical protein
MRLRALLSVLQCHQQHYTSQLNVGPHSVSVFSLMLLTTKKFNHGEPESMLTNRSRRKLARNGGYDDSDSPAPTEAATSVDLIDHEPQGTYMAFFTPSVNV